MTQWMEKVDGCTDELTDELATKIVSRESANVKIVTATGRKKKKKIT